MAITVGTVTSSTTVSALTPFAHTVAEGTDALIVVDSGRNGSIGVPTYDDVALDLVWSVGEPSGNNALPAAVMYIMLAPPVGTADVAYFGTSVLRVVAAINLSGVDQSTPTRTPTTLLQTTLSTYTSSSISPASEVGDLVLDFIRVGTSADGGTTTAGDGQTAWLDNITVTGGRSHGSYEDGASGVTVMSHSWVSGTRTAHGGVALIPASGGATRRFNPLLLAMR